MKPFPILAGLGLLTIAGAGAILHAQERDARTVPPRAGEAAAPLRADAGELQPVVQDAQAGRSARANADDRRADRAPDADREAFDAGRWRERLAQPDLAAREESYAQLLERARRDERVEQEVRAWSRGTDELAWTSRLLLRELDRRGTRGALRTFRSDGMADLEQRMREFHERMDRLRTEFDRDVQRMFDNPRGFDGRWQPGDPRDGEGRDGQGRDGQGRDGQGRDGQGRDGQGRDGQGRDGQGRDGGAQAPGQGQGPRTQGGPGGPGDPGAPRAFGGRVQSRSVQATQGPDGARIEVKESIDGREERRVYEGKTLDEIYAQHPELKEQGVRVRVQGGEPRQDDAGGRRLQLDELFGGGLHGGDASQDEPRDGDRLQDQPLRPQRAQAEAQGGGGRLAPVPRGLAPVDGQRQGVLGIMCQPAGEDLRRALSLPEHGGLLIESVVEGTIAAQVGLRQGDVLVELDGQPTASRDDVARVLGGRRAEDDLSIGIVDASGKRRTLTHRGRG